MRYEERRRIAVPKRKFSQRYPRIFVLAGATLAMCVFFSKPIYDLFFYKPPKDLKKIKQIPEKSG